MNKAHFFIILSLTILLGRISSYAQVPNLLNYQGVALNASGQPISNSNISIRIRFAIGNGTSLYREDRIVSTDNQGHFAFQIGSPGASVVTGSINNVTWGEPGLVMTVHMDPAGGTNYTQMGMDTLTTVPHSFMANKAMYSDTLLLPYQRDDNSVNSFIVNNENTSTLSNAIVGRTFGGNPNNVGVLGEVGVFTANGTGVRGRSYTTGSIAVEGISNAGIAVRAKTGSSGTALFAENTNISGKALDVNGNVKIAGGNTNPSSGAVLTSDATGNATWVAPNKIAFKAIATSTLNVAHSTWFTPTTNEIFDVSGNYNPSSAATDPNTFIAPVSGYYQLFAYVDYFYSSSVYNMTDLQLRYTINGVPTSTRSIGAAQIYTNFSTMAGNYTELMHLNAGEKVKLQIFQTNGGNDPVQLSRFESWGKLEFAD